MQFVDLMQSSALAAASRKERAENGASHSTRERKPRYYPQLWDTLATFTNGFISTLRAGLGPVACFESLDGRAWESCKAAASHMKSARSYLGNVAVPLGARCGSFGPLAGMPYDQSKERYANLAYLCGYWFASNRKAREALAGIVSKTHPRHASDAEKKEQDDRVRKALEADETQVFIRLIHEESGHDKAYSIPLKVFTGHRRLLDLATLQGCIGDGTAIELGKPTEDPKEDLA